MHCAVLPLLAGMAPTTSDGVKRAVDFVLVAGMETRQAWEAACWGKAASAPTARVAAGMARRIGIPRGLGESECNASFDATPYLLSRVSPVVAASTAGKPYV